MAERESKKQKNFSYQQEIDEPEQLKGVERKKKEKGFFDRLFGGDDEEE